LSLIRPHEVHNALPRKEKQAKSFSLKEILNTSTPYFISVPCIACVEVTTMAKCPGSYEIELLLNSFTFDGAASTSSNATTEAADVFGEVVWSRTTSATVPAGRPGIYVTLAYLGVNRCGGIMKVDCRPCFCRLSSHESIQLSGMNGLGLMDTAGFSMGETQRSNTYHILELALIICTDLRKQRYGKDMSVLRR
jgi:hypothetical protein